MNNHSVQITIDGKEATVDASLTILEAAGQMGIEIPTLCHHPALSDWGGCRLCVVEVDKSPKLTASCVTPVRNGMEVATVNDTISASRRMTLEMLFAERNHNCMFCPDSGHCELQKMAYALQMDHLTITQGFHAFPVDVTGEYMTFDHNRCILCGRCVRACQEIAGSYILGFHNRGPETLVGFDLLQERDGSGCTNCGACLQVCPTGAISSRYRTHCDVKGQPAERWTIASTCAGCGLLCPTQVVGRDNQILKIEGVLAATNGRPDRGSLCYKGRFEVLKTRGQRLLAPMVKDEQGRWQASGWDQALDRISQGFKAIQTHPDLGGLFGIASSQLSNEALVLFKELMVEQWKARVDTLDGDHFRNLAAAMAETTAVTPMETAWQTIADADMILLIGADPQNSHPLLLSLLRQAYIERGLVIATLGRTPSADLFSTEYLPVAEADMDRMVIALAAMWASLEKPAAKKNAVNEEQQATLGRIVHAYAGANNPLILIGEQLTGATGGLSLGDMFKLTRLKVALSGENASVVILKPGVNSTVAWRLGLPGPAFAVDHSGGGLLILGDESDAVLNELAQNLRSPTFLAVVGSYLNAALAEKAHVMLPKPLWLEEDGSYIGLSGTTSVFKPSVLDPPPGVNRTWETLHALGQRSPSPAAPVEWVDIRMKAEQTITALNR